MKQTTEKIFCDCCKLEITNDRKKKNNPLMSWLFGYSLYSYFGNRNVDLCYQCHNSLIGTIQQFVEKKRGLKSNDKK